MLWPADLEALLAVCMVLAGFEVFAYCDNFLFLEPCNLGFQSFKGSATRRAGSPPNRPSKDTNRAAAVDRRDMRDRFLSAASASST